MNEEFLVQMTYASVSVVIFTFLTFFLSWRKRHALKVARNFGRVNQPCQLNISILI